MPEPRRLLRLRDHVLLYLLPGKHRAQYETRSRSPSRRKLLRLLRGERGAPLSIVSAFRKAGIRHSIGGVYKTLDRLHADGLVTKFPEEDPTLQEVVDLLEAALSSDPREQAKLDDVPVLTYSLTAAGRTSARLLRPPRRPRSAVPAGKRTAKVVTDEAISRQETTLMNSVGVFMAKNLTAQMKAKRQLKKTPRKSSRS